MATKETGDIAAGRLPADQLACQFADVAPLLDAGAAAVAASRCHYCYDAPCVNACPTQIDIPGFIRKIGNGNMKGAAHDILSARSCVKVRACATIRMRSPLLSARCSVTRRTGRWHVANGCSSAVRIRAVTSP